MKLKLREIIIFGMLGGLMYASKLLMSGLPNIHLIAVFVISTTVVYRAKALYPLYIYVLLEGLFGGFTLWWIPYLYIWTILWGAAMLLPGELYRKPKIAVPVYSGIAALHGLLFGTLWAPAQAVFFGLSFKGMLTWIAAGFPYDVIHGVSNLALGLLIVPVILVLLRVENTTGQSTV